MKTVYLAGSISNEYSNTYNWRREFISYAKQKYIELNIINPCQNIWNIHSTDIKNDCKYLLQLNETTQGLIKIHAYQLIRNTDIFVGHFGIIAPNKPMIGTIFELIWAYVDFKIPTIGIMEPESTYTVHPWIRDCLNYEADSVTEAVDILEYLGCK